MENTRSIIEKLIYDVFDSLELNNFRTLGREGDPIWEYPQIGVASGDDPYYDFLKEHIGPFHWTPAEVFERKYDPVPGKDLRVISMAFPQNMVTKHMQRLAVDFPCDNWVIARGEWEPLVESFCRRLEQALTEKGLRCVFPDLLPDLSWRISDRVGLASNWSQRHTAYVSGLGTFGLSDGLITRRGIAARFTSLVIEADLPVDGKASEDPYGWCTRCGACIRRCPAGAISLEHGHDKDKCSGYEDYCLENLWPDHLERGDYIFGCGLCQAGVPCSDHPPEQGTVQYRRIQSPDNPQLARLAREGLKEHGLDIPGTAFFDEHLDRLYEYYTALPEKRGYFVAVTDAGRIVGGAGIDEFINLQGCGELQKLYVAPDHRKHGIGRNLIRMVEKEAADKGYTQVYLETHSNLQAARRAYQSEGYEQIERPPFSVHETMDIFFIKNI